MARIAGDLGCKVLKNSRVNILKEHEKGLLLSQPTGELFIVLDEKRSTEDCRFTIAHEIGHYMLGHLDKSVSRAEKPLQLTPYAKRELEADLFATVLIAGAVLLQAARSQRG